MKNYNYAYVFYDISDKESEAGKRRVTKVFKLCKKYFLHHQKSVFKGEITPANFIKFKSAIEKLIDKNIDVITVLRLIRKDDVDEISIGGLDFVKNEMFL
ncbi:CRISPR-associated endonuclease Cas2 [Campylobacter fetus]|uniref:CRISPR-associated endoribonuclease Cas2 n=3 Tax=Campylobacter fetus TaxID=196 RepID=A0RNQ8_CAMFF|nr:CRISPR-associated endonuclease Cas2 [Campylobacter fetus]ABK82960.1 crispr-associated protein Cas2 [Campylobacter fetus subsp. fetus 82-40]EAI3887393.1 CRISPR-associated endonuclease Cas2 [Campylobacter fetus]EAI3916587.1 CRISPR-associated endonuclease Cas2 [Campylobacter fetus]EAI3920012.1 CRISPR-associated endonuclease Cas2 [Campylobacter fetus]EAI5408738.1 CRISPR-associated endonuclease Cas2 [Campylobacter fetus]